MRRLARRLLVRRLTVAVIAILIATSAVLAYAVRNVVRDQERRLLIERSHEIVALLSSTSWTTRTTLSSAGTAALDGQNATENFAALAKPTTTQGGSLAVAQLSGGQYRVVAAAGKAVSNGAVADLRPAFIARVAAAKDFASDVTTGPKSVVMTAMRIDAPIPTIAYTVSAPIDHKPFLAKSNSPYRELNVGFYASTTPDAAALLIQYNGDPTRSGLRAAETFLYGSDKWLVVSSARQPLVGSFAEHVPWMILGAGLVLAVLLGLLTEALTRRRAYAMKLVDERTRTLRGAQEAAEAANKAKSEFISRMSHELRTPLNAVLGFGQVLELYEDMTEFQHKAVCHITTAGRHLLDLINEILDLSQVESGGLSLVSEPVAIGVVVKETMDLLEPVAAEHGVTLFGGEAASDCGRLVYADPQRLKQVLLNLIGNGIKYNRQGGSVTVRCQVAGGESPMLRLLVSDTGPGIADDQLPKLFTAFERLGAERTAIEGTGMGLALSKRLVEAMHGRIGVESIVGQGSTFWVELEMAQGESPSVAESVEPAPSTRPAVLYIEDNLTSVKLVEQLLSTRPGIDLYAAMQGSVGLDIARSRRPILILLDVNLPDMDGEAVLRELRTDPRTADLPVVVVSADVTQRQIDRLGHAGASAYLSKPIDVARLLQHIDDAAATRELALLDAALH